MNDEELDADIERMLAKHHARQDLGWSYYATSGHRQPARRDRKAELAVNAIRKRASRARLRGLDPHA